MHVCTHAHTHTHTHIHTYTHTHIYTYTHTHHQPHTCRCTTLESLVEKDAPEVEVKAVMMRVW